MQPAPRGGTAYLMPGQVADAIVRLEERNIRVDEALAVAQVERIEQMRRTNEHLGRANDHLAVLSDRVGGVHHVLGRISDTLDLIADRMRPSAPVPPPPATTPQQLLTTWRAKNLVVTEDVHAVAAHLAPALVREPVTAGWRRSRSARGSRSTGSMSACAC
ncbi:hypothetical protein [Streptomyces sp. NPDC052107]|uniref:hypothetical protein n=1 Tax=Streptomyces sp. NPDC052107 TaxID=3155632 RepID=UPI00341EB59C